MEEREESCERTGSGGEEMVAEKFSKAEGRQREGIYLVQMRVEKKQNYHFFLPKPQRSRF